MLFDTINHPTANNSIGATQRNASANAPAPANANATRRQSHDKPDGLSYRQSIEQIIKKDGGGARGALGVFGRGLGGRVAASALQVKAVKGRHNIADYTEDTVPHT